MRKLFLLLAAIWLFSTAPALAETGQKLVVNGETVTKTVAKMTFEGDNVVLHFTDNSTQTADMAQVTLSLNAAMAIAALHTYELKGLVNGRLALENVPQGASIVLYDAAGKLLLTTTTPSIDMSRMKAGVYVLKVDNQIVKFQKK